jgi:hypothetical protein
MGVDLSDPVLWMLDSQWGSSEAAPGSESADALLWLPLKIVVRRLLPPSSSVSATSGLRLKAKSNLQAVMPNRRPFDSSTVGSRSLAPSGFVPGGVVLDGPGIRRCGGFGAGPDGVFTFTSRVVCAKNLGQFVFSFLIQVLNVFVMPPINESF